MAAPAPPPLVPRDVNLRDFAFMPVEINRLLKSDTWGTGSGDSKAAAITLWLESWHQIPAGSLPSDDRMLARLSQAENWKRSKDHALRGWLLCSDGRIYHPVVCAKALEAWLEKLAASILGRRGNAVKYGTAADIEPQRQKFVEAMARLGELDTASRALAKQAFVRILAMSPPESGPESGPESPPESGPDSPPDTGGDRKGQGQGQGYIPPIPPADAGGVAEKPKRKPRASKAGAVGLKAWLDAEVAAGRKAIPSDDAVFSYAAEVGLPREFLHIAWQEFRTRHLGRDKRYSDWRRVFRAAVRGNWLKVWYIDAASGAYGLTTVGMQAQRAAASATTAQRKAA